MARRVTFLKNFFGWLARYKLTRDDLSASLVLERPLPPLPELLTDKEVAHLLAVAKADIRMYCLLVLILTTGLKKEEILNVYAHHFDLYSNDGPTLFVHYPNSSNKQYRERILSLSADIVPYMELYLQQYLPQGKIFSCTERNLNYIVAKAVRLSGITKRVTLQLLRDTYAVNQLKSGTLPDTLRQRLGLSDEAWFESKEKYQRLAFPK
jgi:integrase/recombinase XerD